MGMSTHVVGIKPPDAEWRRMKKVWDACKEAGISAPGEVYEFFEGEAPDDVGVLVDEDKLGKAVEEYNSDSDPSSGFEVDLTKLPKDVKKIRFYNAW